jgi:hypothetical protein
VMFALSSGIVCFLRRSPRAVHWAGRNNLADWKAATDRWRLHVRCCSAKQ